MGIERITVVQDKRAERATRMVRWRGTGAGLLVAMRRSESVGVLGL